MTTETPTRFTAIGASARALAASITAAGYTCHAIDLFADWDTRRLCDVERVPNMASIVPCAEKLPRAGPLVLGGAMENRLGQLAQVKNGLSICGSDVFTLGKSRDPFLVHDCLVAAKLPALPITIERTHIDERWLVKSRKSAGGMQVEQAVPGAGNTDLADRYFQACVGGLEFGATFVADRHRCWYVGSAQQICEPLGRHQYVYHGSVGPVDLPD
ncbi:MAG: hypothetical protein ACR2NP_19055, partial [Pirellulaceae bacterium]